MDKFKDYLESQMHLSEELKGILNTMQILESSMQEELKDKNKSLMNGENKNNLLNADSAEDRLTKLQTKLKKLLNHRDVKKDLVFYGHLSELSTEADMLSKRVDSLNEKLLMYYDDYKVRHNGSFGNTASKIAATTEPSNMNSSDKVEHSEKTASLDKVSAAVPMSTESSTSNTITSKVSNAGVPYGTSVGNNVDNPVDSAQDKQSESQNIAEKQSNVDSQINVSTTSNSNPQSNVSSTSAKNEADKTRTAMNSSMTNNANHFDLNDKEHANKKMEFKVGTNILNTIGVVLILIAFITFGKYIYTNYMSDVLKGIFLFAISSAVLASGECLFKKKLPRFSEGISALGVAALYASVMINYLVLGTLSSTLALIISMIITGISLWISYINNSDAIRLLSLVGGYICLYPMDYLAGISSYITVAILLMINVVNICIPIKNKKFLYYSSIINVILCNTFIFSGMLEETASKIFLIGSLIINNYMYAVSYKEKDEMYSVAAFLTSLIIMQPALISGNLVWKIMCLAVSIGSWALIKNELNLLHYVQGSIIYISLLYSYGSDLGMMSSVLYCAYMVITAIYLKDKMNSYLGFFSFFVVIAGMLNFYFGNVIESSIYVASYAFILWYIGDKYKNNEFVIFFKNFFFGVIVFKVFTKNINEYVWILCSSISIAYVFITSNISRLKDDNIKKTNEIILAASFVVCNLPSNNSIFRLLISLMLGFVLIYMFTGNKYTGKTSIDKYKILIYSLYSTYAIIKLFSLESVNGTIYNLMFSIILMTAALINVWLGFKLEDLPVRRYGLILSLIVCAKLIIFDFSSADFMIKTILFLIVGIIALVISYIYNKLEQEHKNKKE